MSLALFHAVLASHLGKSSTRFALALMAYHACPRCGRTYCGVTRLANELNVDPRNAKLLLAKLRTDKHLEPTGERTPQGTVVYRLVGVMLSSPEDFDRDETSTGGVMKSCQFCRRGVMKASPNKPVFERPENDEGEPGARVRERPADIDVSAWEFRPNHNPFHRPCGCYHLVGQPCPLGAGG